jgi:hypothetical protein
LARRRKDRTDSATPVLLLLDTCVWLDLASSYVNEPLLAAIVTLHSQKIVDVVVPQIVRDEFANNKVRIVKESGRSLSSTLKRAKVAMWTYGDPKRRRKAVEVLEDIDLRLTNSIDVTASAVARIEGIFSNAITCVSNDQAALCASKRALQKKAPFHNGKNNFADAIIIELYGQMVSRSKGRCVFITHNTKDFSLQNGDQRLPHPDIAQYFSRIKSRYFIRLVDALRRLRPHQFAEAMYEQEFSMEPRRASEISDAIEELTNQVWYDRHMVTRYKIETGRIKLVPRTDYAPKNPRDRERLMVADIWAGALKSARRLEKKYGKNNLGPYSKFDWGMINGKLSALRWVFGEDWDELYT